MTEHSRLHVKVEETHTWGAHTCSPPPRAVTSPGDVELFPWARPASTLDGVRVTCKLADTTVEERILYAEQGTKQTMASPWGRFSCTSTHRQIRQKSKFKLRPCPFEPHKRA